MTRPYVHGYDAAEMRRLLDQAATLADLLHFGTHYPPGAEVLEAGCGVGAQTEALLRNSPGVRLTCIDVSRDSLEKAQQRAEEMGCAVNFQVADIFDLPFAEASFDHVFLCFVLEHGGDPVKALRALKKVLRPGGTLTVIEGDHGSAHFWPDSAHARRAIQCQIALQRQAGGDARIGRRLYPLLTQAGFSAPEVTPRMVYVDGSKPRLADGFTRNTFAAMIEGVRARAIATGLASAADFDQGVADLHRTTERDGVFCYTFFKAVGVNTAE
ncbi:methyltransferase domain-containing protein [Rhodoblastus acidophilus]|uniref:Methyltransferase domain-containing protein n=1 Tax=Rhodoblastus acidophilus TaxID=1074 RepID=A0A6N8DJ32_RHOAC|nr:class I SAM-dependent methyltransferase [Rhodoblastus acidophilus]MCW2273394.1 SAM-dependent methyltransferase [Rhodoblastus acidophilus]MTV30520.1 methyltransferase domain-containing protein [Rhodoblastus acidophilus]